MTKDEMIEDIQKRIQTRKDKIEGVKKRHIEPRNDFIKRLKKNRDRYQEFIDKWEKEIAEDLEKLESLKKHPSGQN